MKTLAVLFLSFLAANADARADSGPVIVHEWGTFTSLQDEHGRALGGINVDDEPVPGFVWGSETVRRHELGDFGLPPYNDQVKGWRPADPDVTMRLETPVIYFYPPKGTAARDVPPLDVYVKFHGGALTQYYPYAVTDGLPPDFPRTPTPPMIGELNSGLSWKGVHLGSTETPVATNDHIWTTPREVSASVLAVPSPVYAEGQMHFEPLAEHFLFYRGLGHVDSPIFLKMPFVTGTPLHSEEAGLEIVPRDEADEMAEHRVYDQVWVVKILPNGACGFTTVSAVTNVGSNPVFRPINAINSSFGYNDSGCSLDNLAKLKSSMHDALVKEGLYDDEATAMLKTWDLSYFKSAGLRFFYIVPRTWVDKVLPLTITGAPAEITRVMVGRIELISDAQKAILARLATGPCPDLWALKTAADSALRKSGLGKDEQQLYYSGAKPLSDLGIPIPPFVQDYLNLGRFRDTLIVNEQQQHPSPELAQFIKDNRLAPTP